MYIEIGLRAQRQTNDKTISTHRIAPSLYTSFMAATKRDSERKFGMAP